MTQPRSIEPVDGNLHERLTTLELSIIRHPAHVEALQELERCLVRARLAKGGKRLTARARLLYGETGSGKTTLIEDFAAQHARDPTEDGAIRPVIVVEMPEATTKRALVEAIHGELGYRSIPRESANNIITDITDKVARLGTELIILDEGQHLVSASAAEALADFLKGLLNRIGCQIVLAGCPNLQHLHTHPQLNRRLMPDIVLEPYEWTTVEGRLEYLTLLHKFEQNMCLPEPSGLPTEEFAMRLYVATGGCIGLIAKYLSEAVEQATLRGMTRIDLPLLAEIYASWHPKRVRAKIGFNELLTMPRGTGQEDLRALEEQRRLRYLDEPNNPFACTLSRCAELWELRLDRAPDAVAPKRRSRGSGPPPIRVFA